MLWIDSSIIINNVEMALAANFRVDLNVPSGGSSKREMVRLERSLSISSNGKQSPTSSGSPPTSRTKSISKHERERRVSRSSRNDNAQGLFFSCLPIVHLIYVS